MRRLLRALVLTGATAVVALAAPMRAHADPDYGKLFDNVALHLRAFTGAAPGFGTSFVNGGDVRLAIEGSSFGGFIDGRFGLAGDDTYLGPRGARPSAAQFVLMDLGCRGFFNPSASTGYYLGGGLGLGWTAVDAFAFENANLYGVFIEGGVDLPRTSPARFTAAIRVDVGVTSLADFSRVPAAGAIVMITANLGFIFGGPGTGSEEP